MSNPRSEIKNLCLTRVLRSALESSLSPQVIYFSAIFPLYVFILFRFAKSDPDSPSFLINTRFLIGDLEMQSLCGKFRLVTKQSINTLKNVELSKVACFESRFSGCSMNRSSGFHSGRSCSGAAFFSVYLFVVLFFFSFFLWRLLICWTRNASFAVIFSLWAYEMFSLNLLWNCRGPFHMISLYIF